MDIVSWTLANVHKNPDAVIQIDCDDPSRFLTAGQNLAIVRQLIAGLKSVGLQPGDCVCFAALNDIYYTSVYLSIIGAGGIFSGANPGYTAHELTHHLRVTGAKYVITGISSLETTFEATRTLGIAAENIFIFNPKGEEVPAGQRSYHDLMTFGESDWMKLQSEEEARRTPAAYISTSGTSGLPKAAIIPHAYKTAQGKIITEQATCHEDGKLFAPFLISLPPFHVFTIPLQHAAPLHNLSKVYIMARFNPDNFVRVVQQYQIESAVAVPPMLLTLVKAPSFSRDALSSLRRIFVGGSIAAASLQKQMYAYLQPQTQIKHVYGMTEVGWAITMHSPARNLTGALGFGVPGTALRLACPVTGMPIDEDDKKGEIQFQLATSMLGYRENEAATKEAFTDDGWVRSGDLGYRRDGLWYIVDRTKDLIKVRGWQVSPAEIESVLVSHPEVRDAAVIGIPLASGDGEIPAAYVVRTPGSTLTPQAVQAYVAKRLSRYKHIGRVRFVESVPRNPTGKILRRILRESEPRMEAAKSLKRKQLTPPPESDGSAVVAYAATIRALGTQQTVMDTTDSVGEACLSPATSTSSVFDSPDRVVTPPKSPESPQMGFSKRRRGSDSLSDSSTTATLEHKVKRRKSSVEQTTAQKAQQRRSPRLRAGNVGS